MMAESMSCNHRWTQMNTDNPARLGLCLAAVALAGCGHKPPPQYAGPPPEVMVETVQARTLPITAELPGRVAPMRVAQVRARVTGIVLERDFDQGTNVQAGQVLYRIDPAPYQAALDSARASVAQAEASFTQAQLLAQRYKPLVGIHAVSKQNYDNAVAAANQGKANLAAAKAAQQTAQINLDYCTVTAPIAGRIGAALVTEGALVSQTAATEMAVIQQLDPIYFDFTEASAEALKLRQQAVAGQLKSLPTGEVKVTLTLPDGADYPHPGKLLFKDVTVDPTSGMRTLRAEFPNPEDWLLPGMFAVGRVEQAVAPQALLVSQPAVSMGPNGQASVMRVTTNDVVQAQPVELGPAVGTNWVIQTGLKAGERVIIEGLQKVHPGMKVHAQVLH
jgi:membrane fusion protein, multidrug efflux system